MNSMSISLTNLNRDELEDKFFKLKEEHLHLKRESSNEKNQMKYLSVKLSRLINEKKRLLNKEKTKREVELEELIYDFQDKMVQLERENIKLKEKSSLLKTQLDSELFNKKNFKNAYAHVQSKTDSGLGQTRSMNTRTASAIVINRRTPTSPSLRPSTSQTPSSNLKRTPSLPSFAFNLLEEAQEQIKRLQRIVALQQNHIDTLTNSETEQRISKSGYKERHFSIVNYNKSKSTAIEIPGTEHQQNYNVTNNYLSDNNNGEQFKRNQQEVHLQKQFMSSGNQVFNGTKTHQEFQNQNHQFQNQHHQFQNQHQHQHHQLIEKMQKELEIERNKSLDLNQKLLQCNVQHNDLEALHQQIQTLEKENEILRNSLEKCIGSCLDDINENNKLTTKNKNSQESKFKDKIINLKKEIKHLKSQLNQEKLKYDQLTQDYQHLQEKYNQMEKQLQSHDNKTDHENYEKLNYCNRSDHRQLKSQLEQMQNERHELLAEFDQMKQALQSFQNSILNQEQDQHDQHGEQDQQDQQDEDLEFNLGSNDDT